MALYSLPRTQSACKISSAKSDNILAAEEESLHLLLAPFVAFPNDNQQAAESVPTPRAAVAMPGVHHKFGHRGSSGIAHRLLLPVQDGGVRAAVAARAAGLEGWWLASLRAGSVCYWLSSCGAPGANRKDQYLASSMRAIKERESGRQTD